MSIEENLERARKALDEDTPENLPDQVAQMEAHEVGRIDELLSRIEKVEMDLDEERLHEKALEERLEKLEKKVESMETVEKFEERLSELEDDLVDFSSGLDDRIDHRINRKFEDVQEEAEDIEKEVEELRSQLAELSNIVRNKLD